MTNNDVLRSIRYLLNVTDRRLIEIIGLAGYEVSLPDITVFLKKDGEPGYVLCAHEVMAHFLNGLVIYKRGIDPSKPRQPIEIPVTNNVVLKKLHVAFELKDTDLIALIEKAGLHVTPAQLSAFFRKSDHRNYRECGDQFLRAVLKHLWGSAPASPL